MYDLLPIGKSFAKRSARMYTGVDDDYLSELKISVFLHVWGARTVLRAGGGVVVAAQTKEPESAWTKRSD
jgi:hypothetical protein